MCLVHLDSIPNVARVFTFFWVNPFLVPGPANAAPALLPLHQGPQGAVNHGMLVRSQWVLKPFPKRGPEYCAYPGNEAQQCLGVSQYSHRNMVSHKTLPGFHDQNGAWFMVLALPLAYDRRSTQDVVLRQAKMWMQANFIKLLDLTSTICDSNW